jgi:hypothetical protein
MAQAGAVKRTVHQADLPTSTFAHSGELAEWARTVLAGAGLDPGEVVDEDWGAMVAVAGPGRVVVACTLHDDGPGGAATITVEDAPRRFRAADPGAAGVVASAVAALAAALPTDATWSQGGPPA